MTSCASATMSVGSFDRASAPLSAAQTATLVGLPGVRHAMPVAVFPQASGVETLAIGAGEAANVALLRADQTPLPEADLFRKILPGTAAPGVALPGRPQEVRLTARLGPASLGLAPVLVSISVQDADGDVYQFNAGTLPADGKDHTLAVPLAGAEKLIGQGDSVDVAEKHGARKLQLPHRALQFLH